MLSVRAGRPGWVLSLPVVFPTIHLGAGWGILREMLASPGRSDEPSRTKLARTTGVPALVPLGSRHLPQPTQPLNALTIDVEDYFHVSGFEEVVQREAWPAYPCRVEANTERILARLDEAGVHATFFVLGWVAERFPDLVRRIHAGGHEIGSHGYWHRLIYSQTPEEFRDDLCRSRDLLQDLIGEKVTAYRAPSFSITRASLWALDVLLEEGFTVDSSIYPTRHDRYGIPGTALEPHKVERPAGTLWEFPPPVWPVLGYPLPVGGGGYFRLYPYALTRRGLRGINATGRPFAAYLHPWELDPEQPRIKAGRVRSFRHYVGLRHTETRLVQLLRDFRFGTLSASLAAVQPVEETPLRRAA
jgi:polysaccharide deacetylase family protein (PEP-CTERM system associated)